MSNLDIALARIELAYCNSPVCGATRLSVLTGIRAQPNQWKTDHMSEEFTTLPAYFKNFGNHTVSIGKVFHHMYDREAFYFNFSRKEYDFNKLFQ